MNYTEIAWNSPPAEEGVVRHVIFADDPINTQLLEQIAAGNADDKIVGVSEMPSTSFTLATIADGNFQFAIVAEDAAGNRSGALQVDEWKDVPFDRTAPAIPTGGVIR